MDENHKIEEWTRTAREQAARYVRASKKFVGMARCAIRRSKAETWTALGTILLSLLTLCLVLDARDTSKRQLKAYLFTDNQEIEHLDCVQHPYNTRFPNNVLPCQPPIAIVRVSAAGQTPAANVSGEIDYEIDASDKRVHVISSKAKRYFKAYLPPKQFSDQVMHLTLENLAVTDQQRADIRGGREAIFVFGTIEYETIFGASKPIHFCSICTGAKCAGEMAQLRDCDTGNEFPSD